MDVVVASSSSTNDAALVAFLVTMVVGVGLYMSPTITAGVRRAPNVGSVLAINLLLGWSLVGWAIAWAMALRSRPQLMQPPPVAVPVAPLAGWYPDPLRPARLRYWTGDAWSDAVLDSTSPPR